MDQQESDLGILDLIQVFVEALDKSFENVCELDLIFHSDRVHYILDEIIMAGMVLETNIVNIMNAINDQTKLHNNSIGSVSTSMTGTNNNTSSNNPSTSTTSNTPSFFSSFTTSLTSRFS